MLDAGQQALDSRPQAGEDLVLVEAGGESAARVDEGLQEFHVLVARPARTHVAHAELGKPADAAEQLELALVQTPHRPALDETEYPDDLAAVEQRHVERAAVAAPFHEGCDVGGEVGVVDVALDEGAPLEQQSEIGPLVQGDLGADGLRLGRVHAVAPPDGFVDHDFALAVEHPDVDQPDVEHTAGFGDEGGETLARRQGVGEGLIGSVRRPCSRTPFRPRRHAVVGGSVPSVHSRSDGPSLEFRESLSAGRARDDRTTGRTQVSAPRCRYSEYPLQDGPGFCKPPRCRDGAQSPGPSPFVAPAAPASGEPIACRRASRHPGGPPRRAVTEPRRSGRLAVL